MTSLNLSESSALVNETWEKKSGFWLRQFKEEATYKQKRFDMIFGVVLPVVCCFFDPLVFRGEILGSGGLLGAYKPFAYVLSYVAIMGLLAFLLMGKKLKWANGFLSGLFFLASAISLVIGIVLLPFSLLGLIILIGALGFTPLFSAFVFVRNAVRAYEAARFSIDAKVVTHMAALSLILSFCLPYLFNVQVAKELKEMTSGNAQTVREVGARLRYVAPLVNFDPLVRANMSSSIDAETKKALAETYFELAGKDIEAVRGFD